MAEGILTAMAYFSFSFDNFASSVSCSAKHTSDHLPPRLVSLGFQ
jgi:hypothetical protein